MKDNNLHFSHFDGNKKNIENPFYQKMSNSAACALCVGSGFYKLIRSERGGGCCNIQNVRDGQSILDLAKSVI